MPKVEGDLPPNLQIIGGIFIFRGESRGKVQIKKFANQKISKAKAWPPLMPKVEGNFNI